MRREGGRFGFRPRVRSLRSARASSLSVFRIHQVHLVAVRDDGECGLRLSECTVRGIYKTIDGSRARAGRGPCEAFNRYKHRPSNLHRGFLANTPPVFLDQIYNLFIFKDGTQVSHRTEGRCTEIRTRPTLARRCTSPPEDVMSPDLRPGATPSRGRFLSKIVYSPSKFKV